MIKLLRNAIFITGLISIHLANAHNFDSCIVRQYHKNYGADTVIGFKQVFKKGKLQKELFITPKTPDFNVTEFKSITYFYRNDTLIKTKKKSSYLGTFTTYHSYDPKGRKLKDSTDLDTKYKIHNLIQYPKVEHYFYNDSSLLKVISYDKYNYKIYTDEYLYNQNQITIHRNWTSVYDNKRSVTLTKIYFDSEKRKIKEETFIGEKLSSAMKYFYSSGLLTKKVHYGFVLGIKSMEPVVSLYKYK